ncbi:MAG: hypothetical protein HXX08_04045 [Chloroflexi bacterium]|uniref:ATPase BadF/BadG/BcrA/BcrD type domain-containing protein n=1 Tax=Candidatus Chlorohelix allophototropha TaxID=3003348 RepID=A0A8T7M0R8_9CHLR|nr:hypothetical protein [Chloroflexota bacterium]WJW66912.1 hypothetical protein OZ401_000157 [Chloroflexota bacterium L227-S17]
MGTSYYIGIEAGSRTIALLADNEGNIVGRGAATMSTYSIVGQDRCSQTIWSALFAAFGVAGINARDLLTSGLPLPEVEAIAIGMPGIEKPKEESTIRRILQEYNFTDNIKVTSDAHIALLAGSESGYGVAVLAGESGLAFAMGENGSRARAGGWGFLLGEEGSAYWVGVEAVKAVLAAADGRAPETALTETVALEWKISAKRPDSLSQQFYRHAAALGTGGNKAQMEDTLDNFRRQVGSLSPLVERAAVKGDAVAISILERAADHLESAARAALTRVGMGAETNALQLAKQVLQVTTVSEKAPLVYTGSLLLSNPGELRRRLTERLEPLCAEPVLVSEPAEGAVRLAMES